MNKKYIDIILSLGLIVLAITLYKSVDSFRASSIVTTGIYIKFLAISLGLASLFELIKASFINENKTITFTQNPKKFFLLIILLIVYIIIMEYFGFIISTLIFLPLTMKAMGYDKLILSLVYSTFIIVFVYLLFVQVFEIPLPEAIIFQ